jgi:hypothetical protein
MRVELRDGQWAELREHITHAQDKEIRRAQMRSRRDPETAVGDGDTAALRVFVQSWNVLDVNGDPIPITDPDAIDRMPADLADIVAVEVDALYHPVTVPNAPTPPSSADGSSDNR